MLSQKLNVFGMVLFRLGQVGFDLRTMWENHMLGLPGMMLFIVVLFVILTVLPLWMICKKAGFSPAISLLGLVPLLGTVLMFYLAFADWPALRLSQRN